MTDEEKKLVTQLRSIRYGVLDSMRLIRRHLMKPGEWEDPTIPALGWLDTAILTTGNVLLSLSLVDRARHEHTLRWTIRKERK